MGKEQLKESIRTAFSNFSDDLNNIVNNLLISPQNFNSDVWAIIKAIFDVLLPVGYSLVALFFIIDFLNKSVMLEWRRWENVTKALLKLVVAKLIIENCFTLLKLMFSFVANIIEGVSSVTYTINPGDVELDELYAKIDGMNTFDRIGFLVNIQPWLLVMEAIKLIIYVIVYGRIIEIMILTALAPLPLSTLAGEGMQNVAKRFLQVYMSVCLQGVVLLIGTMIYGAMMSSVLVEGDSWEVIRNVVLMSLVMVIIFVKSSSWSRQLTGAA